MLCQPFLDRPILGYKGSLPLGISETAKVYLLAGKYTFSYSLPLNVASSLALPCASQSLGGSLAGAVTPGLEVPS